LKRAWNGNPLASKRVQLPKIGRSRQVEAPPPFVQNSYRLISVQFKKILMFSPCQKDRVSIAMSAVNRDGSRNAAYSYSVAGFEIN
jgi:hypothetical protein